MIKYKRLPNGWAYLITRKDARRLNEHYMQEFRRIDFAGTCLKPSSKEGINSIYNAGEITVHGTETTWFFRLEMSGVPKSVVGEQAISLRKIILKEVTKFIDEFKAKAPDLTANDIELRFFMRYVDGVLCPDFSHWKIEGLEKEWAERNPWWQ